MPFEVDGIVKQQEQLEKLLMSNPAMEKKVQGIIRQVLIEVRKAVGRQAQGKMASDPRQAYRAVKSTVYKRILGGSVSILSKKSRAKALKDFQPQRTLTAGQRGGNRRDRSERSRALQSYWGSDRGFILRFLEGSTQQRYIKFKYDEAREQVHRGSQGGKKYGKTINTGRRGRIEARNFFGTASQRAMAQAAGEILRRIDDLVKEQFES